MKSNRGRQGWAFPLVSVLLLSIITSCNAGTVTCPSGHIIKQLALRAFNALVYFDSITCTDGVTYPVHIGDTGNGPTPYAPVGPFSGFTSGVYTFNQDATAGLFFWTGSTKTATYGTAFDPLTQTAKLCPAGQYLSGVTAIAVASKTFVDLGAPICSPFSCLNGATFTIPGPPCTCAAGFSGPTCSCPTCQQGGTCAFPATSCTCPFPYGGAACNTAPIMCAAGHVVSQVGTLRYGSGLDFFNLFRCTDGTTKGVNIASSSGGSLGVTNTPGPFTGYTSGVYTNTGATSGLYFWNGPFRTPTTIGSDFVSQTDKLCPTGQYLSGFTVTVTANGLMALISPGPICSVASAFPNLCLNGGTFPPTGINNSQVSLTSCTCPIGYSGSTCGDTVCPTCFHGGTCASPATSCTCPTGYSGDTCNIGIFNCPSGHIIQEVALKAGAAVVYFEKIKCTNGITYSVDVGDSSTSAPYYPSITGPFRGYLSGVYASNQDATAGLKFWDSAGVLQTTPPYGSSSVSPTDKLCPAGKYLSGIKVTGVATNTLAALGTSPICGVLACVNGGAPTGSTCTCPSGFSGTTCSCPVCLNGGTCTSPGTTCTCLDGFSGTTCNTGTFLCPSGHVVSGVLLQTGAGLDYFDAFRCTDENTYNVHMGNASGGTIRPIIPGPFTGYSSGIYTNTGATSGLYFWNGSVKTSTTYGSEFVSQTDKLCPTGQYLSGFTVTGITTSNNGNMAVISTTPVCSAASGFADVCVNGGTFTVLRGSLSLDCTCPDGFSGTTCSDKTCPICYHGGSCTSPATSCTCPAGYSGDTCNTGNIACPSGHIIKEVALRAGAQLIYFDKFKCTDNINYLVQVGNPLSSAGGTYYSSIVGFFTGYTSGVYSSDASVTSGLFFWRSSTATTATYGSQSAANSQTAKLCPTGQYLSGIKATGVSSNTFASLDATAICSSFTCLNGGTVDLPDSSCTCPTGFSGTTCSCPECQNGTCASPATTCKCVTGYTGNTCACPICLNGGSCAEPATTCTCADGYTGYTCQCAPGMYVDIIDVCRAANSAGLIGIFQDESDRDLPYFALESNSMTYALCAQECKAASYTYFGVQFGSFCFCGDTYGIHGIRDDIGIQDSGRLVPCSGNLPGSPEYMCGGNFLNTIGVVALVAVTVSPTSTPTNAPTPAAPTVTPVPTPSPTEATCPAICHNGGACESPATSCTCLAGYSGDTCMTATVNCPTGDVISSVSLNAGNGLSYFGSITCTNSNTYYVDIGNPSVGGINYPSIAGPFVGYTSGVWTFDHGVSAGLYFWTSSTTKTDTYGPSFVVNSQTDKLCPAGQYLSGISVTGSVDTLVLLGTTPICTAGTDSPTSTPTKAPTPAPSDVPTLVPSATSPTKAPRTKAPTSAQPTFTPTANPTFTPTAEPTSIPTAKPTKTLKPTKMPTLTPTNTPTNTSAPTSAPTTAGPTTAPTSGFCTPTKCKNGGFCSIGDTSCTCLSGFSGKTCTTTASPTSSPTAAPTSTSIPTSAPTSGPTAAPTSLFCTTTRCKNGGSCNIGDTSCTCLSGFSGKTCTTTASPTPSPT